MDKEITTPQTEDLYTNTEPKTQTWKNVRKAKEVVERQKTELYEDDLIYGIKEPVGSCNHCHGTGKEAWDAKGEPILCRCLKRQGKGEWISAKAFKTLCENRLDREDV